jgi:uncharacterized membrane protein (DUF4010 family)
MFEHISELIPPDGLRILIVLFLSFIIGLEREEHKARGTQYAFGGVRTFPLIGLLGYAISLISGKDILAVCVGFAVVGAFLLVSYRHKLAGSDGAGMTTEVTGLGTYVLGVLIQQDHIWVGTTLAVASMLLLELKEWLENLAGRIESEEVVTFTKFLLLSAVILPVVPNTPLTTFSINPFQTWLVVVAVSTVSYGSYVLQRVTKLKGGILLAAVLGGAYSSTVTTVVLAKRASRENDPHLFSGGILIASGVMYLRLAILVGLFKPALLDLLGWPFAVLALVAILGGWIWSRIPDDGAQKVEREWVARNPLELKAAFLFALIFLAMVVITNLVVTTMGEAGVYTLAAIMGVTDVDPFIMGLTQTAGVTTTLHVAAVGIVIAAASNNVVKGIYALSFADRRTGVMSAALLGTLAVAGALCLFLV